jgi:hypothetical protein
MGVGEDETLGDAIAVTIIATGLILNNKWNCKYRAKKNNSYFRG